MGKQILRTRGKQRSLGDVTETQQTMIKLVARQLFGAESECSPEADWPAILSEAQAQAVFSLVFSYAERVMPESEEKSKLIQRKFRFSAENIRNLHYHVELHRFLESHDIPYVILKGQASSMYYPDPMLREMGDVDFLVRKEDMQKVDQLLVKEGFQKLDHAEKNEHHWAYHRGREHWELHWEAPGVPKNNHVVESFLSNIIEKREWVQTNEGGFFVPSSFHHGLVILLHMVNHMIGESIGIRHLCDWLVFENHLSEEEFIKTFAEPLQEIGLWTFAKVITQIGILYFGCDSRSWCQDVESSLCEELLEDIIRGGNFGRKNPSRMTQRELIQHKRDRKITKGSLLRNGLGNIHEKAKRDFPFCKKIPLLFPVGWVLVVARYYFKVFAGKRKNVVNITVYNDAVRRQKLYAKLNLFKQD